VNTPAFIEVTTNAHDVVYEIQEQVEPGRPWVRTGAQYWSLGRAREEFDFDRLHGNRKRVLRLVAVRRTEVIVNEILEG
jgi:hypothetical protein